MTEEPLRHFYVYVLFRENGVPFYVGKGSTTRWDQHENEARRGEKSYRHAIIRKMQARGIEVPRVKLHQNLTEEIAHAYEVALIAAIGRHPNGPLANLTDGGEGISGFTHSPETIAKVAAASRGRKRSPDSIAKVAAAHRGMKRSSETRARITAANRKRPPPSPETIAKMAAALRGKKRPPFSLETRAKLSAAASLRRLSDEQRARIGAASRGHKVSLEQRVKISVANRGRKRPAEFIARMREIAKRRAKPTAETRAKMSASRRGKKLSPEHIARIRNAKRDISAETRAKLSEATRRVWAMRQLESA